MLVQGEQRVRGQADQATEARADGEPPLQHALQRSLQRSPKRGGGH
jgi:hypothetical protein